MSDSSTARVGSVVALWRYPVKSMQGEELRSTAIGPNGLLGDRAYALVDGSDGKVASAKNPRKWPNLFEFQAALLDSAGQTVQPPGVRIALPDGTSVTSSQADVDDVLSRAVQRRVTLQAASIASRPTHAEGYWPDIAGLKYRETVTDFELPIGTFFDAGTVHVLTTATLHRLEELYPHGQWAIRRFRPNVVVDLQDDQRDFVENGWVGRTLLVGDSVRLRIDRPCGRCVMTTLPQADLPRDLDILRTLAQRNAARLGVYASVEHGGTVRAGDPVRFAER
jgi:uncharacterized protein